MGEVKYNASISEWFYKISDIYDGVTGKNIQNSVLYSGYTITRVAPAVCKPTYTDMCELLYTITFFLDKAMANIELPTEEPF